MNRRALWGLVLVALPAPAGAQPVAGDAMPPTQALLVTAALLCAALLVVAIFSLWQSHRMYLDTVQLHQSMTESQRALMDRVQQLVQAVRGRAAEPAGGARPVTRSSASPKPPAATPPAPARGARDGNGRDDNNPLAGLSDVEFAVLEKLVADPGYFHRHSLGGFGANQSTINALLNRGLAKLDGLGRPTVPAEIRAAVRAWLPGA